MKILIRTVNLELDGRARGEVESMLRGGFGQLAHRILRVTVRIVDQNGPRGGEDISAFVDVRLRPRGRLFILETDRDPLGAVRKAGRCRRDRGHADARTVKGHESPGVCRRSL